jgi:hypothetical protein
MIRNVASCIARLMGTLYIAEMTIRKDAGRRVVRDYAGLRRAGVRPASIMSRPNLPGSSLAIRARLRACFVRMRNPGAIIAACS